ncbi:hypothetical protein GCM10011383_42280 [Hymenobacter cavernae]|uniref:DUF3592 domain-containing protein n=2 Tax=Hymenobacter cavernae TaxID=2044852 RepID=A0ABQ1UTC6_9BACT|nr:hypothetical protein GCM10011383_42280 [Hymenobacter cavernae]
MSLLFPDAEASKFYLRRVYPNSRQQEKPKPESVSDKDEQSTAGWIIFILVFGIIPLGFMIFVEGFEFVFYVVIIVIVLSVVVISVLFTTMGLVKKHEVEGDNDKIGRIKELGFTILGLLIFIGFNSYLSFLQASGVKYNKMDHYYSRYFGEKPYMHITIEYEGKLIRTSPTYAYIGRTKNFTFFYNKQTKYAHVYPNSGIKRVYMRD